MCIKGNDIVNAHRLKLLQSAGTVERFAVVSAVLSAAVEQRHDDVKAVCLAGGSLNDTFQVLIMVIRRHAVDLVKHLVVDAVIADINDDKQIKTADRGLDQSLSVSGGEARAFALDQVAFVRKAVFIRPADQIAVDLLRKLFCTGHCDNAERRDTFPVVIKFIRCSSSTHNPIHPFPVASLQFFVSLSLSVICKSS